MKHVTSAAEALPKDPVGPKDAAANDPPNEASIEARRNAQARALFTSLEMVWPEMIRLTDDQRSGSTGRLAVRYEGTLRPLFSVTAKPRFRPAFSLLVMNDGQGGRSPTIRAARWRTSIVPPGCVRWPPASARSPT